MHCSMLGYWLHLDFETTLAIVVCMIIPSSRYVSTSWLW